ncbi:unnamed protein product [Caenorhabditis auriculariae]|uniref:RING-type domain-containing protein n=1 Tax=Caenorhabditis auriculariae TaxID=2777116 RepID=A0A8S1GZK2_9PELO|nr:unnamed protein product [Caenorhabditis auriculariae]
MDTRRVRRVRGEGRRESARVAEQQIAAQVNTPSQRGSQSRNSRARAPRRRPDRIETQGYPEYLHYLDSDDDEDYQPSQEAENAARVEAEREILETSESDSSEDTSGSENEWSDLEGVIGGGHSDGNSTIDLSDLDDPQRDLDDEEEEGGSETVEAFDPEVQEILQQRYIMDLIHGREVDEYPRALLTSSSESGTNDTPVVEEVAIVDGEADIREVTPEQDDERSLNAPSPKRCRLDEPSTSATVAVLDDDDENGDTSCNVCYEDYTSSGNHRLVSLKCGHFFGKSCILRWLHTEGAAKACCPTCKERFKQRDMRQHFAKSVKVINTDEIEDLRSKNLALIAKDRENTATLAKLTQEVKMLRGRLVLTRPVEAETTPEVVVVSNMGLFQGEKFVFPRPNNLSAEARAFVLMDKELLIGMKGSTQMFNSYGFRQLNTNFSSTNTFWPIANKKIRSISCNPANKQCFAVGGEDKIAWCYSALGQLHRGYKIPDTSTVTTICWISRDTFIVGTVTGRLWKFENVWTNPSDTTNVDLTNGAGRMPIIFCSIDLTTQVLVYSTAKELAAFHNGQKVILLTSNIETDDLQKIVTVCFDPESLCLVATVVRRDGSWTRRLVRLAINDELLSVQGWSDWKSQFPKVDTMYNEVVFSVNKVQYSVVTTGISQLMAHDWSGVCPDHAICLPGESDQTVKVSGMLAADGGPKATRKIFVLTENRVYSLFFKLGP